MFFSRIDYELLKFRFRGQFVIKILIVRHINTISFIWIKIKIITWASNHLKTSNLSADNFKKYSTSMNRYLSPRYDQVILVSGHCFDSCQLITTFMCNMSAFVHFFVFVFVLLCSLPWELHPLDPQIFCALFQILYIRFTPYTFSLFNLIMA